jgi:hypothetical protein
MTEATWGEAGSPEINWRMSASLENVPRGTEDFAEVTSLERAVRAWAKLDPEHQAVAILRPESALLIDGASMGEFIGDGIAALLERLPGGQEEEKEEQEQEQEEDEVPGDDAA